MPLKHWSSFGIGNPQPLFFSERVPVVGSRIVGGSTLKLQLGSRSLEAIGFGMGRFAEGLTSHIDILFTIEKNTFRGRTNVQQLKALRPSDGY